MQRQAQSGLRRKPHYETGVAVLSFDTEQMWGYLDELDGESFLVRYPGAQSAPDRVLTLLTSCRLSATWTVVGAFALRSSLGTIDPRFEGLPTYWISRVPSGSEITQPLWYGRSFVQRLCQTSPAQDIGLHGGLTHLIWDDHRVTSAHLKSELTRGNAVLRELGIKACSFTFARNREQLHPLLPESDICCYRGRSQSWSDRFSIRGLRMLEELGTWQPPTVLPEEAFPGLWNIPASLSLYPLGGDRTRLVPAGNRVKRFHLGLKAALREHRVFHFTCHPHDFAQAPEGYHVLEDILEILAKERDSGDIQVLTMKDLALRLIDGPA